MTIFDFNMRHRTTARPKLLPSGAPMYRLPPSSIEQRHELAMTLSFIVRRQLFGHAYAGIQPDYFDDMPKGSGVYIGVAVPTKILAPAVMFPGDVDLLIIPYEGNELILHRVVAVEIKVIRAGYARQGKSPNSHGISQAKGLLEMGFPYSAVAHLIVTDDTSPKEAWREVGVARILDFYGHVEMLPNIDHDMMPFDLIWRAMGRLEALTLGSDLGLIVAYLGRTSKELLGHDERSSLCIPDCRRASQNPRPNVELLQSVAACFEKYHERFLDNPRYDPN